MKGSCSITSSIFYGIFLADNGESFRDVARSYGGSGGGVLRESVDAEVCSLDISPVRRRHVQKGYHEILVIFEVYH